MGQHDALGIEQVAEYQIVNMATMRGDINQGVGIVKVANAVQTADVHTAVNASPEPRKENQEQANSTVGEIRRDGLRDPISFCAESRLSRGLAVWLRGINGLNNLPDPRGFNHLSE